MNTAKMMASICIKYFKRIMKGIEKQFKGM